MIKITLESVEAENYIFSRNRDNTKIKHLEETIEKLFSEKYSYVSRFTSFSGVWVRYGFSGDESELLKENKELRLEVLNLKNRSLIQRILNR